MMHFKSTSLFYNLICGVLCLTLSGCTGKPAGTPATGTPAAGKTSAAVKSQQIELTDDLMNSILAMLKLEALGITTREDEVASLLNQWQRFSLGNQAVEEEVALEESVLEAWRARIPERQLKLVRRSAFLRPDIERLRNLLLMNTVVKHAVGRGKSDLERVVNVFTHLVRNTDLVGSLPDDLPLSPYHLYLLGKATAADRGWLFVELLRQLKIPAVILSAPLPKDADEDWDPNQPFVVGVLLDKQVYLFDPRLGLPLTVPGTAGPTPPIATLEQARANPEILKQYNLADDKPYPITAELLKTPAVLLVGDISLWSYRFSRLQQAFTGAQAMVISEPLIDVAGQPGGFSRVAQWPGQPWKAAQLAAWTYPESRLTGLEALSAQHQQILDRITDGLKMPVVVDQLQHQGKDVEVRRPTNLFLFSRLDHAAGRLGAAVGGYTSVRVQLTERLDSKEIKERTYYAYLLAAEDALFWTGVCKFDQGTKNDRRIATDKLQQYLKVYDKVGRWQDASHILLAHLAAESGNPAAAIAELDKVSPEHPQSPGLGYLKRVWSQAPASPPAK